MRPAPPSSALALTVHAGLAMAADKIVISNWDGYMPADLLKNFKEATGIEAELSLHATNEEIMGKVVAGKGKGYDVLFVSSPFAEALDKLGLAAKLDHAKIANLANLYAEAGTSSTIPATPSPCPMPGAPRGSATAPIWSRASRRAGTTC